MSTLSVFQRLPSHIVDAIAKYYIDFEAAHVDSKGCGPIARPWTTLYDVSYNWRVRALQEFFFTLKIKVSVKECAGEFDFTNLPKGLHLDASLYHSYVKHVSIELATSIHDPLNVAPKDLSPAWPESLAFSSVRSLYVDLSIFCYQAVDEHADNERFYWLSQRIQSSLPKLQSVTIDDRYLLNNSEEDDTGHQLKADSFLSAIFDKANSLNITLANVHLISDHMFIRSGPMLTSLRFTSFHETDYFGYIVRMSAPVLEDLYFHDGVMVNLKSFVFDKTGQPIIYPRLKRLHFVASQYARLTKDLQMDKPIAPYPVLQTLCWHSPYPFEDDTLFRGNGSTLENLDVVLDANISRVLQKHRVFADGKYPRLKHVFSRDFNDRSSVSQWTPVNFVVAATSLITSATRSFSINSMSADVGDIHRALSASSRLENLRFLKIQGPMLTMIELLDTVRLLPSMEILECGLILSFDVNPKCGRQRSFVNTIYSEYYPLSQGFRFWNAPHTGRRTIRIVAESSLILRMLCPSFRKTLVSPGNRKEYELLVRETIESGAYDDHSDTKQGALRNEFRP